MQYKKGEWRLKIVIMIFVLLVAIAVIFILFGNTGGSKDIKILCEDSCQQKEEFSFCGQKKYVVVDGAEANATCNQLVGAVIFEKDNNGEYKLGLVDECLEITCSENYPARVVSNLDTLNKSCDLSCQMENRYSFCSQKRSVVHEGQLSFSTCKELIDRTMIGKCPIICS